MYRLLFFFSSRRRHTRCLSDWSSDVCSSDLLPVRLGHVAPMNSPPAPTAPQQPLQEALALHREGKHELAMQRYVAILQQNPGNVDALYYVAMIAIQQEQFANGLKVL